MYCNCLCVRINKIKIKKKKKEKNNTCFSILTRLRILILLLKEMHCLSSQEVFAKRKFFAEFPRVPPGKLVLLIYLCSLQELRSTSADMARLTRNTVGKVFAMMRYLCKRDLQIRPITPFGGRVFVVKLI